MVKESTIRLMTRLANEHQAVNLSQGFTDESAIYEMVWGAISASLGGTDEGIARLEGTTLKDVLDQNGGNMDHLLKMKLKDVLKSLQNSKDAYNQYCYPFGLVDLRNAIADYTNRFRGFRPDPETEITVVLGATEGLFTSLRAICNPGDELIVMQPYHEMYPAQAEILGLEAKYITLLENKEKGIWELDLAELEGTIGSKTKVLILNTPHNPTGKVFTRDEMNAIADICKKHDIIVITDEIYEHILYDGREHVCMSAIDGMKDRTFVVNAISKTGNATGWRVGWIISPPEYTTRVRALHDTMVIQSPTPLQKGVVNLLGLDDGFYKSMPDAYARKREVLTESLRNIGFKVTPPEGAYYLFADYTDVPALKGMSPMDAATFLIKEVGVATVPGDNFYAIGNSGDSYLRFAFCRSIESLEEAARRFAKLK
ncbi:MAG: pyridoxal phosphate-dependent aminotransferase [Chloroflexi bacterium]|jgi:aspartate/methionine/tyrosine aminotransferase|nr:pyridoxal phosphate-dependent aminotransferase [Chloroflexota bacterium]